MQTTPYPTPAGLRQRNAELQLQRRLQEEFGHNQVDAYVLNAQELTGIWVNLNKRHGHSDDEISNKFYELTGVALDLIRNHTSSVMSAAVMAKLGADMQRSGNLLGTYRIIQRSGSKLIVFRGWPGLRRHLNAPVYGLTHPKVIKMGVGQAAAGAMLRSGVMFTFILSPTIRTIEWLFVDHQASLEAVFARVSTDIVKGVIGAAAGYFASIVVIGMSVGTVVAVAPIAVGIGVAIMVGYGLDVFDESFGITEKITKALALHHKEWSLTRRRFERDANYYLFTSQGALELLERLVGNSGFHYRLP